MKEIINISLGLSRDDYEFTTQFMGKDFHIQRLGANGDLEAAADLLLSWNKKAHAISLSGVQFPYTIGSERVFEGEAKQLQDLGAQMHVPVTAGNALRRVVHEWALRHLQFSFGNKLPICTR